MQEAALTARTLSHPFAVNQFLEETIFAGV
jgi:hypothetical protein